MKAVVPWLIAAVLAALLWWPSGPDPRVAALEAARDSADWRAERWQRMAESAQARNDSLLEAHTADTLRSTETIDSLTSVVQAETARAASLADSIRLRVDAATADLLDDLESAHSAALEAEREQTEEWRARALSAEAGWRDARLGIQAKEMQVEALAASIEARDVLNRALEAELRRANRNQRVLALAGIAGVAWGLTK